MPVFEIPLIGPHYVNREKPLSAQKAVNMWPEINPEARNQVCLHNVAGKRVFAQPGGADRGMHDFNNLLYVISGQTLYTVDAEGAHVSRGTIPGTDRCVMADDGYQMIIVTGSTPYRYTVAGGVEAITDPDLVNPTTVAYINSQFLLDNNNGIWGEFVTSSIEPGFAIDSLDFATAESHPDDLIAIVAFRQLAYMFGSKSVEPWANTGTGNPPWARASSGVRPFGLIGRDAVLTTTEYIYFLDHDRIPRRSNGLDFPSIGNPALGVEFAKYNTIDDCIAYSFIQDAQQFVAFTFPTANRTWCFHEPSGSWFQLSNGINGDRDRASSMINIYGLNYCADHSNGNIYEYSLDIYTDNGEAIIKERDTAMLHGGLFDQDGKEMFIEEVELIIVAGQTEVAGTGLGPQPIVPDAELTNCNEVWSFGTLSPDLHVAGVVSGTWNKNLIAGTGVVDDDRFNSGIWFPDETGQFAYSASDLPEYYYPDCQWYVYSGPYLFSAIGTSTYSAFTLVGTGTEDNSEAGIDGIVGSSSILTDNDSGALFYAYKTVAASLIQVGTPNIPMTGRIHIEKDLAATHYSGFIMNAGAAGGTRDMTVLFHQADGTILDIAGTALNRAVEVVDAGDYWDVYLQMDAPEVVTTSTGTISVIPAYNTDGSGTPLVTLTGLSIKVVDIKYYSSLSQGWPIGIVRRAGVQPLPGPINSETQLSEVHIDAVNHDNTEGGYYIEWRPQYDPATEVTHNIEILSLNDSYGLLYYDYTNKLLTSTDGTNTATKALTIEQGEKYRLGVVFGPTGLQVGVDGEWGVLESYDGSFTGGADFTLFRNPEAVNFFRELRGFQISDTDAKEEITLLMYGGGSGNFLPPPPDADPQTEIVAPYWENTGNWIDLSGLTKPTFEAMFGHTVEGSDFNAVYTVDKAALVNTNDAGNRVQIQDTDDCTNAGLYITDASGNVVDSMIYANVPNGDSVQIPTGANYYVVVFSDTGEAKVKKWDSSTVSLVGSTPWQSHFGTAFALPGFWDTETQVPLSGISIAFTVPVTSTAYKLTFTTIENTTVESTRTGSVGQTVGDYTSAPTATWGIGVNIDCGINNGAQDIELLPGETYFFCVRNNDPYAANNLLRIQAVAVAI